LFTFASELAVVVAVVVVALDGGSADFAATLTHDSGQCRSDDLVAGRVDDRVEDAAEVWKQRQSGVEAVRATGTRRGLHNHSAISCRVPTLTTCHCPRLLSRAPAAAADRRPAGGAAIDRYLLAAGPTAANLQQRRAATEWDGRTDRQTDAQQLHRPCCAFYANSVNNK